MQVLDSRTGMLEPTLAQNASTRHHKLQCKMWLRNDSDWHIET